MWLIDELIKAVATRNQIVLNGTISIGLVDGGIKLSGELNSEIQDKQKNLQAIATMDIPVSARLGVADMVIPVRIPRK
jgi:hypothetical protein